MKKLKNLALVLSGVVLGVSISLTPEIHAATKLLGGKVAKVVDVKLNGKKIGEGAIISSTTYLPVRALVDSLNGVEVGSVTSNAVNLVVTTNEETDVTAPGPDLTIPENTTDLDVEKNNKIAILKNEISGLKLIISNAEKELENQKKQAEDQRIKAENDKTEPGAQRTLYEILKKAVSDSEKQISEYKAQLADLESQLAELQK